MQKISNTMRATIRSTFNVAGRFSPYGRPDNKINYESNNYFTHFFRVKLTGDKFEIPIYIKDKIKTFVLNSMSEPMDYVIPFYIEDISFHTYRTADALVRNIVNYQASNNGFYMGAKTTKGEMYYGANGMILNKDMVPLLFNVLEAHRVPDIGRIVYTKARCYIHPSVFYTENTVEKCIINKIIPFYMQNGVDISTTNPIQEINRVNYTDDGHFQAAIPEIVVKDISDTFICSPILPSVNFTDDSINQTLVNNIEDVISTLEHANS